MRDVARGSLTQLQTPTDTLQSETATVANPPASFLGIPRELRNKIYEHVIKDEQFPDIMDRSFRMRPGLVDVCQQTFGESKQMSDDCSIHSQNFEAKCANRIEVRRAVQWVRPCLTTLTPGDDLDNNEFCFKLEYKDWSNLQSMYPLVELYFDMGSLPTNRRNRLSVYPQRTRCQGRRTSHIRGETKPEVLRLRDAVHGTWYGRRRGGLAGGSVVGRVPKVVPA